MKHKTDLEKTRIAKRKRASRIGIVAFRWGRIVKSWIVSRR